MAPRGSQSAALAPLSFFLVVVLALTSAPEDVLALQRAQRSYSASATLGTSSLAVVPAVTEDIKDVAAADSTAFTAAAAYASSLKPLAFVALRGATGGGASSDKKSSSSEKGTASTEEGSKQPGLDAPGKEPYTHANIGWNKKEMMTSSYSR